jgi:hypothetical protein
MSGGTKIKAVDQSGVARDRLQVKEGPGNKSVGSSNTRLVEPHGNINQVGSETIYQGENNNFIILGRDRPTGQNSGDGGKGHSHTSTIRLIAGLHGRDVKEEKVTSTNPRRAEKLFLNPDPIKDAATIYLSQKTNIDKNFHISSGGRYGAPTGRSAALMKADCIRLIGREGVKIVTGIDKKNSLNHPITKPIGIELIAGNDTSDMQPIAKGKSVVKAFEDMTELVKQLSMIVEKQGIAINALAVGGIPTPLGLLAYPALPVGAATAVTFNTMAMSFIATFQANLANFKELRLKYDKNKLYSRYNMTN